MSACVHVGEECGGVHVRTLTYIHTYVSVYCIFLVFLCTSPSSDLVYTGLCPRHADYVRISSIRILCAYICRKYLSYWHCVSCHKNYTVPCDLSTMLRLMVCLVPEGGGEGTTGDNHEGRITKWCSDIRRREVAL